MTALCTGSPTTPVAAPTIRSNDVPSTFRHPEAISGQHQLSCKCRHGPRPPALCYLGSDHSGHPLLSAGVLDRVPMRGPGYPGPSRSVFCQASQPVRASRLNQLARPWDLCSAAASLRRPAWWRVSATKTPHGARRVHSCRRIPDRRSPRSALSCPTASITRSRPYRAAPVHIRQMTEARGGAPTRESAGGPGMFCGLEQ